MSKLRPECATSRDKAIPSDTALYLIRDSVAKRRSLIYGQLHDEDGKHHCAIGAFFADNPNATLKMTLIDEVAAVNDSIPADAKPSARWRKVMRAIPDQICPDSLALACALARCEVPSASIAASPVTRGKPGRGFGLMWQAWQEV